MTHQVDLFGRALPKIEGSINFSHPDYDKFKRKEFSTIRRGKGLPKKAIGSIFTVQVNRRTKFYVKILDISYKPLKALETRFLIKDTSRRSRKIHSRAEALELLQSFYREPITATELWTIISLRKIDLSKEDPKEDCY